MYEVKHRVSLEQQMTGPVGLKTNANAAGSARGGRAFTLIDVLVTLAVIAVLIGIMMPGLARVKEVSRQVVCRSNVRQVGLGLALYATDARDQLPYSVFIDPSQERENQIRYAPEDMMTLRLGRGLGARTNTNWDGLGLLYKAEVLPSEEVFYCPSHHGEHPYDAYEPMWRKDRGEIVGNYHFRGRGPNGSTRLSFIEPSRAAMAADGMRTIDDYNHRVGLNVLRADLSLFWLDDSQGMIASYVADARRDWSGTMAFDTLWQQLDSPDSEVLPER